MTDPLSPAGLAWQAVRKHRARLGLAVALAAVLSGCRGGLVLVVRAVVDALGDAEGRLAPLAAATIGLFVVQGAARVGRLMATRSAALEAETDLRAQLFSACLGRSPAAAQEDGLGATLAALVYDVGAVRTAVGAAVTVIQRPLTAAAVGGVAFWMAPSLGLVVLAITPIVAGVVIWSGRRTRHAGARHLEQLAALSAEQHDDLAGLRTLQAYGAEAAARRRHTLADRGQLRAALSRTWFQALGPPLVEVTAAAALALVVVLGATDVQRGAMTSGDLVAFLVAVALLHEPLKGIAVANGLWEEARAGLTRVAAALRRPVLMDREGAIEFPGRPTTLVLEALHVDHGRGPVLSGAHLELRAGRIVAIQGETGAGKSTLLDVIARFVEPTGGRVLWNGMDVADCTTASLRACLALVDQSPWLGRGSIADAVRLGRPSASDEEVQAALQAAGLPKGRGLLARVPGGIHARVGDGAAPLSGGERRRIALARALLRDAPIVLLDEPTSGLDQVTEARFLETIRVVAPGRLVLIATHRPTCASVADERFMLEDGALRKLGPEGARCA